MTMFGVALGKEVTLPLAMKEYYPLRALLVVTCSNM